MEYVYATMILHAAGKEISDEAIGKILTAAGVEVDEARVKALIAALEHVDIEDAISKAAAVAAPAAAPAAAAAGSTEAAAEEEEQEEEASEEEALEGLGALFG